MALYRKYRPATFAEVVGQEHVTDPLSTALDTGRISHAYLFSGPRGCGKTSSARILARSLNCEQGPTSRPCGVCASCVALGPGGPGNLDVIELDAASHGGVDDTRELRDRAFYAPAESRYRVFIVDEAHMVTTAGFNALLKIVEEPPAHLIFIFATTEPDKVLPTIRSRTHHYPFRLLPPATMRGLLGRICEQEGVRVEEAVYPLVIRAGGGSPRDSLSVLDQLLAGAGPEGVAYNRALALLGVTDIALIDEAVEALATDDGAALFGTVDRVVEAGHDPRRFAGDLLERIRDLILLRAVPDAVERALVSGPGDVLDRMRDQARRIGPATLTRYAELLHAGLGEMRGATAPRLLLEVVCARMLLPSVSDAESATLQRLERLERGVASGAIAPTAASAGRPVDSPAAVTGEATAPAGASPTPTAPASGSSRRRGAEALAALRASKNPAEPEAPGAPQPETPRTSQPEPRPHPAHRAQSPNGPAEPIPPAPVPGGPADEPVLADPSGPAPAGGGEPSRASRPEAGGSPQRPGAEPADIAESGAASRTHRPNPAAAETIRDPADSTPGSENIAVGADGSTGSPSSDAPLRLDGDSDVRPESADVTRQFRGDADARHVSPDADRQSDGMTSTRPESGHPAGRLDSSAGIGLENADAARQSDGSANNRPGFGDAAAQFDDNSDARFRTGNATPQSHDDADARPGSRDTAQRSHDDADARARSRDAAPQSGHVADVRPGSGDATSQLHGDANGRLRSVDATSRSYDNVDARPGSTDAVPQFRDEEDAGRPSTDAVRRLDDGVSDRSASAGSDSGAAAAGPSGGAAAGPSGGAAAAGPSGDMAAAGPSDVADRPQPSAAASDERTGFPADADSAVPAGGADATREIEAAWGDIRSKVREFGAAVHALLSGAAVSRVEGETIVFTHQHAALAQRLSNPKNVEAVESAVRAVLGRGYGVRWEVGGPGQPAAGARSSAGGAGARAADSANGRPQGGATNGTPARPQNGRAAASPAKSAEPPRFSRPSQSRASESGASTPTARSGESGKGPRNTPPDDDIPPPEAPDLPDDPGPADYSSVGYSDYPSVGYDSLPPASTPEEEREMLAESARPVPPEDRRDPDEVALELLRAELGATRLEG